VDKLRQQVYLTTAELQGEAERLARALYNNERGSITHSDLVNTLIEVRVAVANELARVDHTLTSINL
jgi:hypothetical protein